MASSDNNRSHDNDPRDSGPSKGDSTGEASSAAGSNLFTLTNVLLALGAVVVFVAAALVAANVSSSGVPDASPSLTTSASTSTAITTPTSTTPPSVSVVAPEPATYVPEFMMTEIAISGEPSADQLSDHFVKIDALGDVAYQNATGLSAPDGTPVVSRTIRVAGFADPTLERITTSSGAGADSESTPDGSGDTPPTTTPATSDDEPAAPVEVDPVLLIDIPDLVDRMDPAVVGAIDSPRRIDRCAGADSDVPSPPSCPFGGGATIVTFGDDVDPDGLPLGPYAVVVSGPRNFPGAKCEGSTDETWRLSVPIWLPGSFSLVVFEGEEDAPPPDAAEYIVEVPPEIAASASEALDRGEFAPPRVICVDIDGFPRDVPVTALAQFTSSYDGHDPDITGYSRTGIAYPYDVAWVTPLPVDPRLGVRPPVEISAIDDGKLLVQVFTKSPDGETYVKAVPIRRGAWVNVQDMCETRGAPFGVSGPVPSQAGVTPLADVISSSVLVIPVNTSGSGWPYDPTFDELAYHHLQLDEGTSYALCVYETLRATSVIDPISFSQASYVKTPSLQNMEISIVGSRRSSNPPSQPLSHFDVRPLLPGCRSTLVDAPDTPGGEFISPASIVLCNPPVDAVRTTSRDGSYPTTGGFYMDMSAAYRESGRGLDDWSTYRAWVTVDPELLTCFDASTCRYSYRGAWVPVQDAVLDATGRQGVIIGYVFVAVLLTPSENPGLDTWTFGDTAEFDNHAPVLPVEPLIAWEGGTPFPAETVDGKYVGRVSGVLSVDRPVKVLSLVPDEFPVLPNCLEEGFAPSAESLSFGTSHELTMLGFCLGSTHRLIATLEDRDGTITTHRVLGHTHAPDISVEARLEIDTRSYSFLSGIQDHMIDFLPLVGVDTSPLEASGVAVAGSGTRNISSADDTRGTTGWLLADLRSYRAVWRICDGLNVSPHGRSYSAVVHSRSTFNISSSVVSRGYVNVDGETSRASDGTRGEQPLNCEKIRRTVYDPNPTEGTTTEVGSSVSLEDLLEGVTMTNGNVTLVVWASWIRE